MSRYCNKCGYVGDAVLHKRQGTEIECGYMGCSLETEATKSKSAAECAVGPCDCDPHIETCEKCAPYLHEAKPCREQITESERQDSLSCTDDVQATHPQEPRLVSYGLNMETCTLNCAGAEFYYALKATTLEASKPQINNAVRADELDAK